MSVTKNNALRSALRMEKLEERCVPNAVPMTADEQYFLELVNRARLDPTGEAARLGIELNEGLTPGTISATPKQPLAANTQLLSAIRGHLNDLLVNNFFDHTGSNGSTPWDRIEAAGYTNWSNAGENLAWTSGTLQSPEVIEELHNLLFIDQDYPGRGHRVSMMNGDFREVGSGILISSGAALAGQNFGTRFDSPAALTGVAFNDAVRDDDFYTPGEGLGSISIQAVSSNGQIFSTTTSASGGYSLELPNGTYTITFESSQLPGGRVHFRDVQVNGQNVKLDLNSAEAVSGGNPSDGGSNGGPSVGNPPIVVDPVEPTVPVVDPIVVAPQPATSPITVPPTTPQSSNGNQRVFAGADLGSAPLVRVFGADGRTIAEFYAFEDSFRGGVRLSSGDVNGDGVEDIIAATGPGRVTEVRVFDGNNFGLIGAYAGFEASFQGGLYASSADFNDDGRAEVVLSPDEGGGPRIRILDGASGSVVADFFGIDDPNFRGGARVAAGDMNGDGRPDLAVGAGFGGGPRLAAFDGIALGAGYAQKLVEDFFVFEQSLRNGVFLSLGDITGDRQAELVVGGGPGGAPRVQALDGATLSATRGGVQVPVANFFAGDLNNRGGVRVAVRDLNGDGRAEVVTGLGQGNGLTITDGMALLNSGTPSQRLDLNTFGLSTGIAGVFVG